MARAAALATIESAQQAADLALLDGATALGAVLTGFFTVAGERQGVLFSPLSLLVGGLGSGVFAYDGRNRQPGRDARRPRGLQSDEPIPVAARVAVPGGIFAAAVACAFHPGTTILSCVRPGVTAAKQAGASGRAQLLDIIATRGATALHHPAVRKAMTSQFGTVEDGLVTPGDLTAPHDIQVRASEVEGGWKAPWAGGTISMGAGSPAAVVAGDARGLFAALSFSELPDGPTLEPFQTVLPLAAVPVRRGLTRVRPGEALEHGNGLLVEGSVGDIHGASAYLDGRTIRVARDAVSRDMRRFAVGR